MTTTAPAGSVSTLTQTTSGIENAYAVSHLRRRKISGDSPDDKVDFVDATGDKWQHYKVYHKGVKDWMEITGKDN
jgi:ribonucleoside-diphosphate reductase alpha chain